MKAKNRYGHGGAKNGGEDGGKDGAKGGFHARKKSRAPKPAVIRKGQSPSVIGGGEISPK